MKTSTTIGIRSNNFSLIRVINKSGIIKNRIIILVCLICLLFVGFGNQPKPVFAPDNAYYVATTGNDSNPGTLTLPWLTPQHAFDTAIAGDTVYFRAGRYNTTDLRSVNSGSVVGGYITFRNYPGEVVEIHMYENYWNGFNSEGKSYLKIIGLNFYGEETNGLLCRYGLWFKDCDHILVQDCYINNTYWCALYCTGCSYITYDNVEIDHCRLVASYGEESMSICNSHHYEVKNCKVHDSGIQAIGICLKEGSHDGSVHDNEIYNLTGLWNVGIYLDSEIRDSYNIDIYNNKIHDIPQGRGININDEGPWNGVPASDITDIYVYNNIIWNCKTCGFGWTQGGNETYGYTTYTNCYYVNNTVYNCDDFETGNTGSEVYLDLIPAYTTNCVIRNNIFYSTRDGAHPIWDLNGVYAAGKLLVDHNLWYNSGGSWSTSTYDILGTNIVEADPLFTSINNKDFSIPTGSPAIDAGSATGAPSTDYNGTVRPQGAGVDIGAYEYQTGSPVALEVTTNALPNGNVGAAYSQTLSVTGGSTPYIWTIASGTLPAGLSLSSSGVISGTPATAGGPISITFQVTDSDTA